MDRENIRLKCPSSERDKLDYDISLSESEYRYKSGMQSPMASALDCREENYSEEDSSVEEILHEVASQDEKEETAEMLLAMILSTTARKLERPLGNPAPPQRMTHPNKRAHVQTIKGSGERRLSVSNKASDDSVVENLWLEMQEMKQTMRAFLQAGAESVKKTKPNKTLWTKDKASIPQEDQARCVLLQGKQPAQKTLLGTETAMVTRDHGTHSKQSWTGYRQKTRKNPLRNCQGAKARNCIPNKVREDIQEATAQNLHEAFQKMEKLGFAVIHDYTKLTNNPATMGEYANACVFQSQNLPTYEQATYHTSSANSSKNVPKMETIFKGVKVYQSNINFIPVKSTAARDGTELRQVMKYGTASYKAYQKTYKGQPDDIIKGMFHNHIKTKWKKSSGRSKNWTTEQTIVIIGAQDHQHPHYDQGKLVTRAN
jgi:hypothetical protein